jgi:hypothetical protein
MISMAEGRLRSLRQKAERHVLEQGRFKSVFVMRAHGESRVENPAEGEFDLTAGGLEFPVDIRQLQQHVIAALLEPHRVRRFPRALNLARRPAGLGTELQRSESVAMDDDVDVGRVRLQRLSEHQPCDAPGRSRLEFVRAANRVAI